MLALKELRITFIRQGIKLADKHFELFVRRMRGVCIIRSMSTAFIPGEVIGFEEFTQLLKVKGFSNLEYEPCVLGISRATLAARGFLAPLASLIVSLSPPHYPNDQ